jgi:hypothetical protein
MTDVIQAPSAPDSPSPWWQTALTVLIAVVVGGVALAALVLTIWGVVEDDPVPQGRLNPRVFDDARLLTPATIARIESTVFPPDVPVIVRTVDRLDARVAAADATDRMERETAWQTLRPRTWHQSTIKRDTPWGSGIYILVSKDPPLMQVRFGERIRLEAYRAGLAAGPGYRRWQDAFRLEAADTQVGERVEALGMTITPALELPWPLSSLKTYASVAFAELEEFVIPAEGVFRRTALRAYVGLLQGLGAASSGWRFVAMTGVIYLITWATMTLVVLALGTRFEGRGVVVGMIGFLVVEAGYLTGAIASLLLLSNGRMEDELLLRDLGLAQAQWVGFGPEYFSAPGGFLLMAVTAFVAFCRGLAESIADMLEARKRGVSRLTLGFIGPPVCWGALALFLPRALGLFALFHQLARLFTAVVGVARSSES